MPSVRNLHHCATGSLWVRPLRSRSGGENPSVRERLKACWAAMITFQLTNRLWTASGTDVVEHWDRESIVLPVPDVVIGVLRKQG